MEKFNSPAVIWFIAGFIFFLLEFIVPGLILFFFAIGAWIVAITSFFLDISINSQLYLFIASTLVTLLLFRKWIKKILWVRNSSTEIENELIGKTARTVSIISPQQNGKVEFKGVLWDARSDENISTGENVTIVGNESILLIVKSFKNIA